MKKLLLLAFFIPVLAKAQLNGSLILSGRVVGESHESIASASVAIKGTTAGTVTDSSGKFSLVINQKFPFTVVVSSVGFAPQEIEIKNVMMDTLTSSVTKLCGVLILVFFKMKRKPLTLFKKW